MKAPWHVSVLIPARNEEQLLPRCLHSVLAACAAVPFPVSCDIVVAVDCSTDQTWEIAHRLIAARAHGAVVRSDAGIVGHARAFATDTALLRHLGDHSRWWLANTDADCEVPADWLVAQLALAEKGAHAVAGIVDVDSFHEHDARVEQLFRSTYILPADRPHAHVHGANLGMRADAYLRAGGWHCLATAEDHDLWKRLNQHGAACISTDRLRVVTSGRRTGRAPSGFADALAAHNLAHNETAA